MPGDVHIIHPRFEPLLRQVGFNSHWAFTGPGIVVWRRLDDRENCTFEAAWPDGRAVRLHIKRYPPRWAGLAEDEARALETMDRRGIGCCAWAAWGRLRDGRGFIITEDLAGYRPADQLIAAASDFAELSGPLAELAGRFHAAGLHHRDFYLCHFFVRPSPLDVKLIDAARVRPLPGWPTRRRWIVKDLAQFWYSTVKLPITDAQRLDWLKNYRRYGGVKITALLRRAIGAKARRIAAHDARLIQKYPQRHASMRH
jgi:Lipopolysaccharide kinase (Kdo/WaaP) family